MENPNGHSIQGANRVKRRKLQICDQILQTLHPWGHLMILVIYLQRRSRQSTTTKDINPQILCYSNMVGELKTSEDYGYESSIWGKGSCSSSYIPERMSHRKLSLRLYGVYPKASGKFLTCTGQMTSSQEKKKPPDGQIGLFCSLLC